MSDVYVNGLPTASSVTDDDVFVGNDGATTKQFPATAVRAYAQTQVVNAQTGTSYTLVAADFGKLVTLTNGSAITLTLPQDSDATYPIGGYTDGLQGGAGQVSVVAGTGASLVTSGSRNKASAQGARFGVQKIAANTWSVFGDLVA